ncbi:MAG: ABC transporter substrate-binding protein [Saprospiraceae bacterium]|nr:ABC transporter substrate-binding protein [Saprospiraceae bacterium]
MEQGLILPELLPMGNSRIVSLVPSLSWYIQDLIDHEGLIGVTKFCTPQAHKSLPKHMIGGTKTPDLKKIIDLKPDLILANKEENNKKDVEHLALHAPVYVSSVSDLNEMYQMMLEIGIMVNLPRAQFWIQRIKELELDLKSIVRTSDKIQICYLIWRKPYMTVGGDTFIHHILEMAGFENVFKNRTRYPEISLTEIQNAGTQITFLSSEPYPFKPSNIAEFAPLRAELVDGKMFSWYGSYMEKSFSYLKALNF